MPSLNDILNETEEVAPIDTDQPEDTGQPRDETGRFAPKGEKESASPAPESEPSPEPQLEHPALIGERRRRQEAEARIAEYEAQLAALRAPQPQQPQEPPSIWDDEQGAFQHFGNQVVSQATAQATLQSKVMMSEMLARQANPDFDDLRQTFTELSAQNPTLVDQCLSSSHPWDTALKIAKNHRVMQELGVTDVTALEAKLREKIMAEMQASQQAQPATPQFPVSLAGSQSARTSAAAPQSPPSLEDILRR